MRGQHPEVSSSSQVILIYRQVLRATVSQQPSLLMGVPGRSTEEVPEEEFDVKRQSKQKKQGFRVQKPDQDQVAAGMCKGFCMTERRGCREVVCVKEERAWCPLGQREPEGCRVVRESWAFGTHVGWKGKAWSRAVGLQGRI